MKLFATYFDHSKELFSDIPDFRLSSVKLSHFDEEKNNLSEQDETGHFILNRPILQSIRPCVTMNE